MTEQRPEGISRRAFVIGGAASGAGLLSGVGGPGPAGSSTDAGLEVFRPARIHSPSAPDALDLAPARWIWYPSQRTLQNTFILFRRTFQLGAVPSRATGWIIGESRYLLTVNGIRVQFGPAPCDPRWTEADPVDLAPYLRAGENVIGATVLYYGQGEGTWPGGKPGFLFNVEITGASGSQRIVSDASWSAHLARSWRPGQYKRWYLRALQEEFDARLHPHGWAAPGFASDASWLPAMEIPGSAARPAICHDYGDYLLDTGVTDPALTELRARSVPLLHEREIVPVHALREAHHIRWIRPAEEYFESLTPSAFETAVATIPVGAASTGWAVEIPPDRAVALTFELEKQIVGWPRFTIEAPAGTTVELMVQESHRPGGSPLLNTHFHSWSRFVCRDGVNEFEAFDYESLRWLQLHVRGAPGTIRIRDVGVRRRRFPWSNAARAESGDARVDRVTAAALLTLSNAAQDTIVDGMGRERQQYSGDVGHQLHLIHQAMGETRLPARYLRTYSQGLTLDGFFLDSWPAYDRLARLPQRQLGLSRWGPLLDHGVGFNFDSWYHYLYRGEDQALHEVYPRLARFFAYLQSIRGRDGLLPVEDIGVPVVWMDNFYKRQRHKQCAFNLYAAAMAEHAFAPLSRAFGSTAAAHSALRFARELRDATVRRFWSAERGLFVSNLPWVAEEGELRTDDRSLATAVLFDQCPRANDAATVRALVAPSAEMSMSYPANSIWRYWALAKGGRTDVVLDEIRTRWAELPSVKLNGTLQEHWHVEADSGSQWSHCPVSPLVALYTAVAGIMPTAPGFRRYRVRPQPANLERLAVTSHTVRGPLELEITGSRGDRELRVRTPAGTEGELVVDAREELNLRVASTGARGRVYLLPGGSEVRVTLRHT